VNVYSCDSTTYDLSLNGTSALVPIFAGRDTPKLQSTMLSHEGSSTIKEFPMRMWEHAMFMGRTPRGLGGRLTASIRETHTAGAQGGEPERRRTLRIVNQTRFDVSDCLAIRARSRIYSVGQVAAGASAEIPVTEDADPCGQGDFRRWLSAARNSFEEAAADFIFSECLPKSRAGWLIVGKISNPQDSVLVNRKVKRPHELSVLVADVNPGIIRNQ